MAIELTEAKDGKVLVVNLIGTLVKQDYPPLVAEFKRLAARYGKIRVLLDMTRFEGWDASAIWPEIKFDVEHLNEMDRMAVVGEKRWQHAIAEFAKPLTTAQTRYFDGSESTEAAAWLAEP